MRGNLILLVIFIIPLIGSYIGWIIGKKEERYRDVFNIFLTGMELVIVTFLYKKVTVKPMELYVPDIMGTGLHLKLDVFRYIFVWVTVFIWFLITIYSTQYLIKYKNRNRYYAFFMLTLGSTLGIFLSENLLNLFTFFEIMSFTSYILVIHDEDEYAHEAGRSYISMAIIGGLILLMGLFLLFDYTGTVEISLLASRFMYLDNIKYIITTLIIIGFGVKASMVPLHVWLPKAHPAAPTPASAVLSGILVKTGIFGIMIMVNIIMQGDIAVSTVIMVMGFINMFLGGFLALFQRNTKRILAYSSMSQMGYILVGLGLIGILKEHKEIAIYATLYHIFNHAIFKVLLFLCAGIIYMIIHDLSINIVRGFGKHKTILKILFIIGFFAIIGMPGFNGFISKTLLHEALAQAHHKHHSIWFTVAEVVFTISSSFTVAYLLKIFVTIFLEESEKYRGQYKSHIKKRAVIPMLILSFMIIFIGLQPNIFLRFLDGAVKNFEGHVYLKEHFYTISNIKNSIIPMIIGLIIFFGFIKKYLRRESEVGPVYVNPSLNWFKLEENLYIPVGKTLYKVSSAIFHVIDRGVVNIVMHITDALKALSGIKIKKPEIMTREFKRPNIFNKEYIKRQKERFQEFNVFKKEKVKEYKHELITFSDILEGVRNRLNSIIYAVFIFAVMIIIILALLLF
ncbi:complex I subunit 5 family protein [Caminicella sporogenes]|uniref:complex I subunit 5 family protein n=1 Tax=Caminicella sporogenes TaxID=166485 RepID=UPI00254228D7|nr:proton-conducting transporter membrane subunit [Caminicella sporogenes]WIF95853.1 proton-conducting transporter membrane subunit [Caminicella sporogenes]